jgi:hypothetical protein
METGNGDDQKDTFIIWDWVEGVVQAVRVPSSFSTQVAIANQTNWK